MAWSQEEIIDWYKADNPRESVGLSDEEVYSKANEWGKKRYQVELDPYVPTYSKPKKVGKIALTSEVEDDFSDLGKTDTSPTQLKGLYKLGANIGSNISLAGGLAEMFPNGLDLPGESFDISPEFFQKSYNESLAGQAYQAIYGEDAYDLKGYTNDNDLQGWTAEAGQFMLGMVNAPEALAFVTGSKLGIWGMKATSALHKYGLLGLRTSAIKSGVVKGVKERALRTAMVSSGLETGISLGTLGAAHTAAHNAATQKKTKGEIDVTEVFKAGAKGFGESFLVGLPAGAVAKGALGSRYAAGKLASNKNALDLTTKVLYGLPSQIGTEALAFTTLPALYKGLGQATGLDAPLVDFDEALGPLDEGFSQSLFQNTVVIGTMSGFSKYVKKVKGIDETHEWALKLLQQGERDTKKILKTQENVKAKLEDVGINFDTNPEMLKIISEQQSQVFSSKEETLSFKKNQKTVNDLIEKIANDGPESLTPKEITTLSEMALPIKLAELGLWKELEQNPNMLRKIIEEKAGKKITEKEFEIYKDALDLKMEDTVVTFNKLNEIMTGIPSVKPGGAKTTPKTTDTVLDTPETYIKKTIPLTEADSGVKRVTVKTVEEREALFKENEGIQDIKWQWKPEQGAEAPAGQSQDIAKIMGQVLVKKGLAVNFKDNIATARKVVEDLKQQVFTYIDKGNVTRTKENKREIALIEKNMKDVVKGLGDITAVVEFGLSKRNFVGTPEKYRTTNETTINQAKTVAKYVNWLHKTKKKKIETSTLDDVLEYSKQNFYNSNGEPKKGGQVGLSALSKFYEHIDGKFVLTGAGFKIQKLINYDDFNRLIKESNVEIDTKDFGKVNQNIQKVGLDLAGLFEKDMPGFQKAAAITGLIKYGIRPEEINKITKLNLKEHKEEGWYIDFGKEPEAGGVKAPSIYKNKTNANRVPITKELANILKSIPTKSDNTPLFYNFTENTKIGKKKIFGWIAEKVFGKRPDGKTYQYQDSRHLLKRMAKDEGINYNDMSYYLRHETTRMELTYTTEGIKAELIRHKKIQKKLGIGEGKFQLKAEGKPVSAKELAPWLDAQIKKNPGLVLKKLKDADFVGRFYEGVIDVTMGKANKFTFFHENAHRLKNMINASGNKRLNKVWNQAEKLFKKEAKGRNMEEFLADEIAKYGLRREQPATIKQKMGGWLNRVWSTVKSVFFGKENLTKNDVKNILGEKVFKGFAFNTSAKANSIARYKYASTEEFSKGLKKQFNDSLADKLSAPEKKALEAYIASAAGIENYESFRLGSSKALEADLVLFQEKMKDIPFLEIKGTTEIAQKATLIKNIELNSRKVFSPKEKENIMKLLGFKSKTLWGANVRELKAFSAVINKNRMPGQDRVAGIAENATSGELSDVMREMNGIMGDAAKIGLPVEAIMRKLGLKRIASNMEDHISAESNHVGKFIEFEDAGAKIMGKGTFDKAKEHLYLIDSERYVERLNKNLLKNNEKKFISKAFKSDWVTQKDGKTVTNVGKNKKYKNLRDAINENSAEGKMIKEWDKFTEIVYQSFKQSVKANMNEAEYLNFINDNKIEWIRENIYVSRLVTEKFKMNFNLGGKAHNKLVQDQAAPLAKKLAKEKFKTDKPTDEQMGSVWEDAEMYVKNDIADMMTFHKGKHGTRFLKKRHVKLPEFVEIDGKKIKVYETAYENTAKKYALGMAKFMANVEWFPEFVKLKGFNFLGQKAAINKLIEANNKWGTWAKDRVMNQLGYLQKPGDYRSTTNTLMAGAAQVLAKTQLSFPTSGLKNLVLGQSAILQVMRVRDYFSGIALAMSKEFRQEVRGTGATEVGLRHIQQPTFKTGDRILNKLFWFGGMKPTENTNRYMSIAASRVQQNRLVNIIQNSKSSKSKIAKAERRLETFYSISKNEMVKLKKYGMNNVDDVSFSSAYKKSQERRVMQNIYNKMNTMAHIKTQGASLSFFMPEWADGKFLRPLTLFKRMAYAHTNNSLKNFKLAYKNGNMVKMGMHMLGPYLTGSALISLYDALFDQKPPTENSDGWAHMKYTFIRGEFLGILSDFIRMYEGDSASQTLSPALYNYMQTAYMTIKDVSKENLSWKHGAEEMAAASFGAYRGYIKAYDKIENKYFVGRKRASNLWYSFIDENYPNKQDMVYQERQKNKKTSYYGDLKTVFEKGSAEAAAKQYYITIMAVATDFWNTGLNGEGANEVYPNFDAALKQATSTVRAKITSFNPNPASVAKASKTKNKKSKFRQINQINSWHQWLKKDPKKASEYINHIQAMEYVYHYKARKLKQALQSGIINDPELQKILKKERSKRK